MIKNNNAGFSLLETLVSILLLSTVLMAGLSFYMHGDEFMTRAMHKKMAQEIANSRMENIKRAGYTNLPNPCTLPAGCVAIDNTIQVGTLAAIQTVTVGDADPNYKQIEVRIDWAETGKISTPQDIEVNTFMAP